MRLSRNWSIQYRCESCEVGGIEGPCWMCGIPMLVGDVTVYQRRVAPDKNMFDAITSFAPKEFMELKVLDGLVPREGDLPRRGLPTIGENLESR